MHNNRKMRVEQVKGRNFKLHFLKGLWEVRLGVGGSGSGPVQVSGPKGSGLL